MNTTPDAEMPDSYAEAWIVELKSPPPMQGPTYWGLDDDEAEGIGWTHDHLRAQRFSRKEDAEMMIEYFGWTEAHAVEHAWGFPPKAPSPSVERMPMRSVPIDDLPSIRELQETISGLSSWLNMNDFVWHEHAVNAGKYLERVLAALKLIGGAG